MNNDYNDRFMQAEDHRYRIADARAKVCSAAFRVMADHLDNPMILVNDDELLKAAREWVALVDKPIPCPTCGHAEVPK